MPLIIFPIVKNSHILVEIYFIFLKERPRPNASLAIPDLDLSKTQEVVIIKRQILALFRKLVNLILG